MPATDLAVELGNIMTASMVMLGAYVAATGMVALDSLDAAVAESLPPYRTQHVGAQRAPRCAPASTPRPRELVPAAWTETEVAA